MLEKTAAVLQSGIDDRCYLGAQIFVSLNGEKLMDLGLGDFSPGCKMTDATINPWRSAGKPLTAAALGKLREAGRLDWDHPVIRYLPEFSGAGKEYITIRHLLTHTAGLRRADKVDQNASWQKIIAEICRMAPDENWIPEEKAGYHVHGTWYLLGEIVQRVSGEKFSRFLEDNIFAPLGMSRTFNGPTGKIEGCEFGNLYRLVSNGLLPVQDLNAVGERFVCRPGSNTRGPMKDLGRFYEAMLGMRSEGRFLTAQTRGELSRRQRIGLYDQTFQHVMDWGLGFAVNSNRYGTGTVPYGYGKHASDETYGHGGSQSSCGFGDPGRGLAVAWFCNSFPGDLAHQARLRSINEAIYEDLGFDRPSA